MRFLAPLLLILALLPLGAGCSARSHSRALDTAEAIIDTLPDSALAILAGIDSRSFADELSARYALLMSQALDKNEIYITDDSVIASAYEFYALDPEADPRRRMMTFYYRGLVEYNASRPAEAIYSLAIADTLAGRLGDNRYRGLANSMMALAYTSLNDRDRDLEHSLKALRFFRAAGDSANIGIALRNIASGYAQTGQYDSALAYFDSVSYDDSYFTIASTLLGLGRIEEYRGLEAAYPQLKSLPQIQSLYAFQLVNRGLIEEGEEAFDNAYRLLETHNDTIHWITSRLLLLKEQHNHYEYSDALETLLKYYAGQSETLRRQYSPNSESEAKDYIALTDAHTADKKRQTLYFLIAIASLIALVAVMAMIIANKSAQQKYERLKLQLAELSASKSPDSTAYDDIPYIPTAEDDTDIKGDSRFINERKHNLDNLFNRYIVLPSSDNTDARRMLRDEINSYRSFDFNERIDRAIDLRFDNYMKRAKAAHLSDLDVSLLRLTICGFSNPQIGVILDENKGTIATRRSRLKGKIARAGLPEAPVI